MLTLFLTSSLHVTGPLKLHFFCDLTAYIVWEDTRSLPTTWEHRTARESSGFWGTEIFFIYYLSHPLIGKNNSTPLRRGTHCNSKDLSSQWFSLKSLSLLLQQHCFRSWPGGKKMQNREHIFLQYKPMQESFRSDFPISLLRTMKFTYFIIFFFLILKSIIRDHERMVFPIFLNRCGSMML